MWCWIRASIYGLKRAFACKLLQTKGLFVSFIGPISWLLNTVSCKRLTTSLFLSSNGFICILTLGSFYTESSNSSSTISFNSSEYCECTPRWLLAGVSRFFRRYTSRSVGNVSLWLLNTGCSGAILWWLLDLRS